MSRYTHTLSGQEAKAVAGLPDLSLPSSEKQIATDTDDKSAEVVKDGSKKLTPKWTPKLTPTAFPDSNKLALTDRKGNRREGRLGIAANHNCLQDGEIETESTNSSSNDNKNGEGGIRTRGTGLYPYDGLANRCLKPLGHLSERYSIIYSMQIYIARR
jgi:hypothetical protein